MADFSTTDVDAAIQFMAQQGGGAERVLAIHRRLPDGRCRGCLTTAPTCLCCKSWLRGSGAGAPSTPYSALTEPADVLDPDELHDVASWP